MEKLTRRLFLGLAGAGAVWVMLGRPPAWARRKLKVTVDRISSAGRTFLPTIGGGVAGSWPSYTQGYAA